MLDETGFGISTYPPDGRERILVVDCERQEVSMKIRDEVRKTWSFEKYVAAANMAWKID